MAEDEKTEEANRRTAEKAEQRDEDRPAARRGAKAERADEADSTNE